jgi:hypothetical protein
MDAAFGMGWAEVSLNHPLTIARFAREVKGANRPFQAVNRPFGPLARRYTEFQGLEQQLHQIRKDRAKQDCQRVCVQGETLFYEFFGFLPKQ